MIRNVILPIIDLVKIASGHNYFFCKLLLEAKILIYSKAKNKEILKHTYGARLYY